MNIAIPVFGGLGLLLYGMNLMGSGLQKAAGDRLKKLIEVLTNNRLMAVLVGALVTMLIQSSSATTVMVVGFVNAGMMTLTQAVGIIMGANIGTTITAQLIAFNLTDYAPIAIIIGVAILLISKHKKSKDISDILIGFGILFIGMDMMGSGLAPLADSPVFADVIQRLTNPFLASLVGMGLTTILQSSSASIGILQGLANQGLLSIDIAFPILFGENIGTTTTALVSSFGANKTAKRAALIHFLFNLIGTLIFMTILRKPVASLVQMISPGNVSRQMANGHTLFNILNVAIQLPFANLLVKVAERLISGEDEKDMEAKYLDLRILETPSIALGLAVQEAVRMGNIVEENLLRAKETFVDGEFNKIPQVKEEEDKIDELEKEITAYLIELGKTSLSVEQKTVVNNLINIVNDLERVGDHAENISELAEARSETSTGLSKEAQEELTEMFLVANEAFLKSMQAFETKDKNLAREVLELELEVNRLEQFNRNEHIRRLNEGTCNIQAGVLFLDSISNLERISDHATNIANLVLDKVD